MSKKAEHGEREHISLYRAYRPHTFADVRGQDHIVTVLTQAIERETIGHAYLFAGTRGTGKTSVARIFARAVGCTDKDLYEIDAASNRGIDDIRELRDGVHTMPFESPYKVYIIDEVHMLTKEAFNALLKTLEEPPAHAIFILATTELHKVPDTIQSRCEVYLLKQPSRELLRETVTAVAKEEGSALEPAAAELIAILAEGSFRDALGILQKTLTIALGANATREDVERVSGAPQSELIKEILGGIVFKDVAIALGATQKAARDTMDARVLIKLLMHHVRAVLMMRYVPGAAQGFEHEFGAETFKALEDMAKNPQAGITSDTLRTLLCAYTEMTYAALPYVPLELALIDITTPPQQPSIL
jgi:DNA polymerase-3 subunit gamma/tau